jgi:hypothetical protein
MTDWNRPMNSVQASSSLEPAQAFIKLIDENSAKRRKGHPKLGGFYNNLGCFIMKRLSFIYK